MSDYIPDENLVQIFKRLPVESLLRFRSVCKCWKQLIDSSSLVLDHLALQKPRSIATSILSAESPHSPPFVVNHLTLHPYCEFLVLDPQTLPLFHTLRGPTTPEFEDEAKPAFPFYLVGTLHGIVCLYDNHNSIYLWNPSMRKLLNVVSLPERMRDYKWHDYEDSTGAGTYSAFWIEPSSKHFKIVLFKLLSFHDEPANYGAIYSSIEGDWKELPVGELFNCGSLKEIPALIIDGVAYWRAFRANEPAMELEGPLDVAVVISFDFIQERFDTIDGPSIAYHEDWFHPVLCSNGQGTLSLVYFDRENRCDFYSRQEEGSWVKLFGFDLPPYILRVLWVLCDMEESGGVQVGEVQENIRILAATTEEAVVLFDTSSGCCLPLKSTLRNSDHFYVAHDFVESLLFP